MGGQVHYYYNNWPHYLDEGQRESYWSAYGAWLDGPRTEIKVFFDSDGWLHIDGCQDPELRAYLTEKMGGWYAWASNAYERDHPRYIEMLSPSIIIEAYAKPLKPGFWQLSHGGAFVNIDRDQMAHAKGFGIAKYDTREKRYVVETGYPRLDRILEGLYGEYNDGSWILDPGPRDARARLASATLVLPCRMQPCWALRCAPSSLFIIVEALRIRLEEVVEDLESPIAVNAPDAVALHEIEYGRTQADGLGECRRPHLETALLPVQLDAVHDVAGRLRHYPVHFHLAITRGKQCFKRT